MSDNVIEVIARYVQENEEALKQFREDLVGLGDDTEQVNEKTSESSESNTKQSASFTELKSAIGIVQQGYHLLEAGLEATSGKTVSYADNVRALSLATGQSTEESSKQLQVLDDFGLGLSDIETASKKMTKNGLEPTIETLADLSERYLALEPGQERNKFLQDELGKSGIRYAEVLSKGKEAILKMNDGIDDNLILSQKQVDSARQLEIAQDSVNDAHDAVAMTLGNKLIPIQTDFYNGVNVMVRGLEIAKDRHISLGEAMNIAGSEIYQEQQAMIANKDAAAELSAADDELAASIQEVSAANQGLLGLMSSISSENRNYIEQQEQVKTKQGEVQAKIDELIAQGWSPLSDKVKDLQADYDNLGLKYDENAAKHQEAMNKILYDLEIAKLSVGGLTNEEMILAQQAGLAFGQLDQNSIDTAKNFDLVAQAVADGKIKVEDMARAIDMLPNAKSIDVVINALVHTASDFNVGHEQGQGMQGGYAAGGISTGPASGHMELLHGTEAVIPLQNGSIPVALMGNGGQSNGGGNTIQVVLQINTPIALFDQQQGKEALLDYVEYGVKALQERGVI